MQTETMKTQILVARQFLKANESAIDTLLGFTWEAMSPLNGGL